MKSNKQGSPKICFGWLVLFTLITFPLFSFANPTVSATGDTSICVGQGAALLGATATGGTAPYYYAWTCNTASCALDSVNDDDPLANPTVTTMYYVQVVDFNGCASNIDSVLITVNPLPIVLGAPTISICADSAPCEILNPTVTNSTGPFNYSWFPGNGLNDSTISSPCARPAVTTDYYLQATSWITGCTNGPPGTDSSAWTTVLVQPIPIADAGPDRIICFNDTVQLNGLGYGAGPSYDFVWSPSIGLSNSSIPNPAASPGFSTDYVLTVFSNGCPSYGDTVRVQVNPLPPSSPTITQVLDTLYSSPADPGNGYQWCLNGQPIPFSNQQYWVPTVSGNYAAKFITSSWGCPSPPSSVLLGQDASRQGHIQVYPQPFRDELVLEFYLEQAGDVSASILDIRGRVVWENSPQLHAAGKQIMHLDAGAELSQGIYLLKLNAGEKLLHSQQLIRQ